MKLKVLFHDNCFDGAASAAVFSRFYLERINPSAELAYEGLAHQAGGKAIDESQLNGDENAIVDFRYSQSPRLTWWFDHHKSAFQVSGDEAHFRADRSGRKFHDANRKSCTKFIAAIDRKSTRLNSSHANISYAVFCLKKKKNDSKPTYTSSTSTTTRTRKISRNSSCT